MRHLNHNATSPIVYIDGVIAAKKAHKGDGAIIAERKRCKAAGKMPPADMTYKERCKKLRELNEGEINKYEVAFNADDLATVPQGVPVSLSGTNRDCEDMDDLYSFRCEEMQKLWFDVLSTDGYLNDLCPICEAVKAKTFDHYLPQTGYQLFAVHPLNLIPCCSICNGHKLKIVFDENNKRKYWNAYLDSNTRERYLFCDISEENGMPKARFRVEKGRLPDRYFEIVKNTFDDLKLDENYGESSGREIVKLKDSCCNYFRKNPAKGLDACLQVVADTIPDSGVNNWVEVLDKALIGTDVFKRFVVQALKQEYGIDIGRV